MRLFFAFGEEKSSCLNSLAAEWGHEKYTKEEAGRQYENSRKRVKKLAAPTQPY